VTGELHCCGGPPSSEQAKVTSVSEAVNLTVTSDDKRFAGETELIVVPRETELIVVTGGPVSEIHVALGGVGSLLPAWSLAATLKVCGPSGRPV
jgi:CO/xanthine dehydrogenase FAD-binding subunit